MATQTLETPKPSRGIARFIPILAWLPTYDRAWLVADILAGLTLWGLLVPEGMAYAGIAGLAARGRPIHAGGLPAGLCPVRIFSPPLRGRNIRNGCLNRLHRDRCGRNHR